MVYWIGNLGRYHHHKPAKISVAFILGDNTSKKDNTGHASEIVLAASTFKISTHQMTLTDGRMLSILTR